MGAPPPGLDRGGAGSWRARRASLIVSLALLGLLAGALWGAADEPRYEARASVVAVGDDISPAALERYSELGSSRAVARRAAARLGDDVPGADLLANVTVLPLPEGGGLSVTASAAAPDVAAASAGAYARALARAAGGDLELGAEAQLPAPGSGPAEDRPVLPWALAGLLAGLLAGVLAALALVRRDAPEPATPTDAAPVASAAPAVQDAAPEAGPVTTAGAASATGAGATPVGPAPESATAEFEALLGAPLLAVLGDPSTVVIDTPLGWAVAEREREEVRHLAATLGLGKPGAPRVVGLFPVSRALDPVPIAVALALAGSELRLRTLLVEADLGHPGLARLLGARPAPGLLEHLRGEAGPRDVLRGVDGAMEPGVARRLACVPAGAGSTPGEAERLLSGARVGPLLGRLSRAYELVVVAGPPLGDERGAAGLAGRTEAVVAVSGERDLLGAGPGSAAAHLGRVPLRGGILAAASSPG